MARPEEEERLFPIGAVARKTGLSTHVLRAWERRYGVVEPKRVARGARLYDEDDVLRLRLLKRVTDVGHPIGQVARKSADDLLKLLKEVPDAPRPASSAGAERFIRPCVEAMEGMDGARLNDQLMRAAVLLGSERFVEDLVVPLLVRVGELWETGTICPAHEHLFSTTVRRVLGWMMERIASASGPVVICTTLSGQRHELGSMLSGVVAAEEGWQVEYLGPDLPADDIAAAVGARRARAVALSVVHEVAARALATELQALGERIPDDVTVLVGGRAAAEHRDLLARTGATWLPDLRALRRHLRALDESASGNGASVAPEKA